MAPGRLGSGSLTTNPGRSWSFRGYAAACFVGVRVEISERDGVTGSLIFVARLRGQTDPQTQTVWRLPGTAAEHVVVLAGRPVVAVREGHLGQLQAAAGQHFVERQSAL